jgi:hypothetical protein
MKSNFILIIFCFIYFTSIKAQDYHSPVQGDICPELMLKLKDSTSLDLTKIEGAYFLLFFWHYSCSHCHQSLNKIEKFLSEQKPEGLKVISIYPFAHEIEKFWEYVADPENYLIDSVFVHCTDPKAETKRKLAPKSNQPPHLVLIDKQMNIIQNGIKASELPNLWKKIKN